MTKSGRKLIAAVKEAAKVARCDHDWKYAGQAPGYTQSCDKCGGRLHRVAARPEMDKAGFKPWGPDDL